MTAVEATQDILQRQLPALAVLKQRGEIQVDNVDVFFDKGIFEYEDTKRILEVISLCGARCFLKSLK